MYLAVTLAALENNLDWNDPEALAALAQQIDIAWRNERIYLDGRDVTDHIRTLEITSLSRYAADNPDVRGRLVALQRQAARGRDVVSEGRDQGTVVFPDAGCKIFLTASPDERARRRHRDLVDRGETVSFAEVFAKQQARDHRDATRKVGPLRKAKDAVEINTDGLSCQAVVGRLEAVVRARS